MPSLSELSHKDYNCLIAILESIEKIIEYSNEFSSPEKFFEDTKSFDATMMNFVVIGEMVDKLSDDFKSEKVSDINWFKIKGLRNIVAHNYFGVDAEEIMQIIDDDLVRLKTDIHSIIQYA